MIHLKVKFQEKVLDIPVLPTNTVQHIINVVVQHEKTSLIDSAFTLKKKLTFGEEILSPLLTITEAQITETCDLTLTRASALEIEMLWGSYSARR